MALIQLISLISINIENGKTPLSTDPYPVSNASSIIQNTIFVCFENMFKHNTPMK